jgi:RNA polymerase sigma-70 factor (ECF subfamily)
MDLAREASQAETVEAELLAVYPALVRRLALVLRDADGAQDVAQAAMERALKASARTRVSDVRAWLYTIGLRLAFNELRRRSKARTQSTSAEPAWAMSTDPDLWKALTQFDPRHRAALLLSVLEGYTHAEIGQMLSVPEGTVSSWLSRMKERLRELLAEVSE